MPTSSRVVHIDVGDYHAACCTEDGQTFTWVCSLSFRWLIVYISRNDHVVVR
jgi:hypothetical protein